jgi:hypothetical protein
MWLPFFVKSKIFGFAMRKIQEKNSWYEVMEWL